MILYKIIKAIFYVYLNTFYSIEYKGKGNLPKDGPVIVCSNHKSWVDPAVLGVLMDREIHFLAKQELFSNPLFIFLLKGCGAISVNRQAVGMSSFKEPLKYLKDGKVIGIFSQATRKTEVNESEAKGGVALFAAKSGAVVVPVGIGGNYKLFSKVTLSVGEPMDFAEYKDKKLRTAELREMTTEIMGRVKVLAGE